MTSELSGSVRSWVVAERINEESLVWTGLRAVPTFRGRRPQVVGGEPLATVQETKRELSS